MGRTRCEAQGPDLRTRHRPRATYTRPHGVRHLFAAYDLGKDKLYGPSSRRRTGRDSWSSAATCAASIRRRSALRSCSTTSPPHLTTKKDNRVGDWAAASNVGLACTPTNSSWLNRIEAQFTTLRYFALDGTDQAGHREQGSMIRRYIIWRNKRTADEHLRKGRRYGKGCLNQLTARR